MLLYRPIKELSMLYAAFGAGGENRTPIDNLEGCLRDQYRIHPQRYDEYKYHNHRLRLKCCLYSPK